MHEHVESLYAQTTNLLKTYRSGRFSSAHITLSLELSDALQTLLKTSPDPVCGQLLLYKRNLPYVVNLCFNTSLLTSLLCLRHRINETCAQQLVCSIGSIYGFHQAAIEQFAHGRIEAPALSVRDDIKKALNKVHLEVWASGYQLANSIAFTTLLPGHCSRIFHKLQKIVLTAHLLSLHLTPRKGSRSLNFAKALKQVAQQHSSLLQDTLRPLFDYPGLVPPGSTVRLNDAQLATVLSLEQQKLVLVDKQSDGFGDIHAIDTSCVTQLGASQPISKNNPILHVWGQAWREFCEVSAHALTAHEPLFKLDRPPPVLLQVQKQSISDDVDLDKIASLILSEPSLVEHVRTTATSSNRQNIPVKEVKHGLLIHGYQRTVSLLIQQALILRLSQHYFPLQEQFVQFTRLRMSLAAGLLSHDSLLAERSSTLACFACSGLFTSPEFKSIRKWHMLSSELFNIATLTDKSNNNRLHRNALILASAWGQSKEDIKALEQAIRLPSQTTGKKSTRIVAAVLGSSLILARQIYFSQPDTCHKTQDYLLQACKLIGLEKQQTAQIALEAIEHCHLYCPLDA